MEQGGASRVNMDFVSVEAEFAHFQENSAARFLINRYGGKRGATCWRPLAPLRGVARKNLQYSLMFEQDGSII